ncbi:MAG: tRNA-dihydrouridine synthase family protein, partial [Muribaculaceae bacterium]|nr:tRNA-dihydrouridine synthase family protein [Muribaculaceae bacterium]
MKLFVAPLQGYTDAPFRHFHNLVFGGADGYFSPFLRVEKGEPARRTMRDILSPLPPPPGVVPQVIFKDAGEFAMLAETLKSAGFRRIDLNMGCPFPPQVRKGRGAGFLLRPAELGKVAEYVAADSETEYSVKMRLGVDDPGDWKPLAEILRGMPLAHVTIHPRTAREQYRGELHLDGFEELAGALGKPVVFNGEVLSPDDIARAG